MLQVVLHTGPLATNMLKEVIIVVNLLTEKENPFVSLLSFTSLFALFYTYTHNLTLANLGSPAALTPLLPFFFKVL